MTMALVAGTDHDEWYYFTHWNVWLIFFYYTLATCASIVGIIYYNHMPATTITNFTPRLSINVRSRPLSVGSASNSLSVKEIYNRHFHSNQIQGDSSQFSTDGEILNKDYRWIESTKMIYLCTSVHIFFEFLGATSFFVTLLDFIYINRSFQSQQNVSMHFMTSLSFIVEMMCNRMTVYIDHYRYMALWVILYAIVIWATTYTDATALGNWPYSFLATDTRSCFLYYEILIAVSLLFYGFWVGLSHLKHVCLLSKQL